MTFKPKLYYIIVVTIITSTLAILVYNYGIKQIKPPKTITKIIYKNKIIIKRPKGVLLSITKQTLLNDISNYKSISINSKAKILKAIYKYSAKYKLNPLLVYSVLATESSFRFWIKHSIVTITITKKSIKTRAIGIGAIIWEWWSKDLISNNIATVKSDLFQISNNIEATCYILNKLSTQPILKGTTTKQESAFLRYFGGGSKNKWYVDKVNKVMSNLLKQELYK